MRISYAIKKRKEKTMTLFVQLRLDITEIRYQRSCNEANLYIRRMNKTRSRGKTLRSP